MRIFEDRALRKKVFEPKSKEAIGDWRKLHIEELRVLYLSTNIVRVNKSRTMRLMGHVTRVERRDMRIEVLVEKREGKTKE